MNAPSLRTLRYMPGFTVLDCISGLQLPGYTADPAHAPCNHAKLFHISANYSELLCI